MPTCTAHPAEWSDNAWKLLHKERKSFFVPLLCLQCDRVKWKKESDYQKTQVQARQVEKKILLAFRWHIFPSFLWRKTKVAQTFYSISITFARSWVRRDGLWQKDRNSLWAVVKLRGRGPEGRHKCLPSFFWGLGKKSGGKIFLKIEV